jgi:hypothetical protein
LSSVRVPLSFCNPEARIRTIAKPRRSATTASEEMTAFGNNNLIHKEPQRRRQDDLLFWGELTDSRTCDWKVFDADADDATNEERWFREVSILSSNPMFNLKAFARAPNGQQGNGWGHDAALLS